MLGTSTDVLDDANAHLILALADLARSGPDRRAPLGRQCSPFHPAGSSAAGPRQDPAHAKSESCCWAALRVGSSGWSLGNPEVTTRLGWARADLARLDSDPSFHCRRWHGEKLGSIGLPLSVNLQSPYPQAQCPPVSWPGPPAVTMAGFQSATERQTGDRDCHGAGGLPGGHFRWESKVASKSRCSGCSSRQHII